jgi:dihydroorotase
MTTLIRDVLIKDRSSVFHNSRKDILIRDGVIESISTDFDGQADEVIAAEGLCVSPGWVDIFTHCCEPGHEYKETLESGAKAAAAGGFTHIFVLPNTSPAIHNKSMVEFVAEKKIASPVTIHPLGAISRNTEGKDLAEMYDMYAGGAIAFTDGWNPVQSAGLMIKALQYVKVFNGVIIQLPDDKSIAPHGLMNEGIVSTRLGLPGKPIMAEELMIARDIKLARYTGSRLHFTGISSGKSVEYIKRGKDAGIDITCSVTPQHMYFTEEDLQGYDTNLKINLPLRSKKDAEALKTALAEGIIDCVTSHHQPHAWDQKICEFEYAKPGMSGLETAFGVLGTLALPLDEIINSLSTRPRMIFGLPPATLEQGGIADLTLFLPDMEYTVTDQFFSKSRNNAFIGKNLKGKVFGVIHKNKTLLIS